MSLSEKTILELVSENHSLAEPLHFLGIHFYDYTEHTLEDICDKKGLKLQFVLDIIKESLTANKKEVISFKRLPIDLLIEYLKHNHYIFIKQRLPYILYLVNNLKSERHEISEELKMILPLFIEDFIHHVYEEEDTLFSYIILLSKSLKDQTVLNKVQAKMMEHSIKRYQADHELHDDQLKGLRRLTLNFEIISDFDLNTKLALSELKKLDSELHYHAKVENNILFPKAIELERKVLALLHSKISLN